MNPTNDVKVQKIIDEVCKKKNSNTGEFRIIVVNTIYDIIPYVLVDPDYVTANYPNGKYKPYDKTCDWTTIMVKNDGGFDNNVENIDDVVADDENDENEDNEDNEHEENEENENDDPDDDNDDDNDDDDNDDDDDNKSDNKDDDSDDKE